MSEGYGKTTGTDGQEKRTKEQELKVEAGGRGGRKKAPGSRSTDTTHLMARAFQKEEMTTSKDVRDDPPAACAY